MVKYCTKLPEMYYGSIWPADISLKILERLNAECLSGFTASQSGIPRTTCQAGNDSLPGQGIWGSYSGACQG